ncbi:MotA/TolQ/ExbB proton channel family protein [Bradyrhizobium oligotrophicum S58]|uniref:MotA/TolQ/ExbB proton channel family protein n=1 Tax=Bradyrhizobium oligotrophicum S58 TaxID=1245469 RepID=M4Z2J2_9BRAD|nr:hypothetical protein [Bradyrhizobium oligotrophicum]BAM87448.1 MotA/TolQ/ExbB proton channel family protein [Bradyrhizobium oligotrophicum S58]
MEKQIAQIRNKMIGLIAIIALGSAWQWDFIAEGVMAHVYTTGSILSAFGFSIVMSFIFVSKLKNEVIAFNALKEMWDDIRKGPVEQAADPLWRHYRCSRPGRVFRRPRLLGHAYDLVTEELARTKKIRISVETMNTLVHKISQTIDDEKSLLGYMSGLLVFMGLIGTFIGLLHMVGSMGGIIGTLASSTGGGGAGADAFQQLLGALQEPLKGMASGFAASLFGLFSSLIVGLLNRMAGQAGGVLKHGFESWLAGVVQIGDQEREEAMGRKKPLDGAAALATSNLVVDYAKVSSGFDDAVRMLHGLQTRQDDHARLMEAMMQTLSQVSAGLGALTDSVTQGVADELSVTRDMLSDLAGAHRELAKRHAASSAQLASAIEQNGRTSEEMSARLRDDIGRRIEKEVREAIGPVGLSVADQMAALEQAVVQFAHNRAAAHRAADAMDDEPPAPRTDAGMGLSEDLGRLDLDDAPGAYSDIRKEVASALAASTHGVTFDGGRRTTHAGMVVSH